MPHAGEMRNLHGRPKRGERDMITDREMLDKALLASVEVIADPEVTRLHASVAELEGEVERWADAFDVQDNALVFTQRTFATLRSRIENPDEAMVERYARAVSRLYDGDAWEWRTESCKD